MKKLISFLLCFVLLIGVLTVNAVAISVNYCKDFDSAIGSIYLGMRSNDKNIAEGEMFPTDLVYERTYYLIDNIEQYGCGEPEITPNGDKFFRLFEIPAAVFESTARTRFSTVDLTKLRAFTYYDYDPDTQTGTDKPCYNADANTYTINYMGGYGDSAYSDVIGYAENGNGTYTVYSFCADHGYDPKPGDVDGKDYFYHDDCCDRLDGYLKVVLSIKNKVVKFHSWEYSEQEFAKAGNLITPDMVPATTTKATTTTAVPTTTTVADTVTTAGNGTTTTVIGNETTTVKETATTTTVAPTGPNTAFKPVASTDGVVLSAVDGVFPKNATVKVAAITEQATISRLETALSAEKFVAYEITASAQPNGTVVATFNIPAGYDPEHTAVIYVAEDGTTEQLNGTVNADTRVITAELTHFSTYAVVELEAEDAADNDETGSSNSVVMWVLMIVGVLLIAAAAAIFVLVVLRKKGK